MELILGLQGCQQRGWCQRRAGRLRQEEGGAGFFLDFSWIAEAAQPRGTPRGQVCELAKGVMWVVGEGLPAQIVFVLIFSLASWSSEERFDLVSCYSGPVELWVDVPGAVLCCSEPGLSTAA